MITGGGAESQQTGLISGVEYDEDAIGDMSEFPLFFEWTEKRK